MKKLGLTILIILLIAAAIGFKGYTAIWGENVNADIDNPVLYIPKNADLQMVVDSLTANNLINNVGNFELTAKLMKYGGQSIKSGRYDLSDIKTNRSLLSKLRIGDQDAINVIINGGRTIDEVIDNIATQMTFTSVDLKEVLLSSDIKKQWETSDATIITKIVPDTYQMYWDTSPSSFVERLGTEYQKYWNPTRIDEAAKQSLTPDEVITLASIVEKETNQAEEYGVIAGVYLNRLKRGMLLQADPTVVFANGDFTIRRVLNKHLRKDSPYNTYMYAGLPPGPICLPSKGAIEGVLNPQSHKYLYFCAQPNYSGNHDFSKNLIQHNNYANKYRRWLSSQGIRK